MPAKQATFVACGGSPGPSTLRTESFQSVKVKHLRPGDWVITSEMVLLSDSHPGDTTHLWRNLTTAITIEGLLISIIKRPGNNLGPLAIVLTQQGKLHEMQASHILERTFQADAST